MDWRKTLEDARSSVHSRYDQSLESLLDRMGLEQKRSTMEVVLPALGIFGAGIAVGAALGILFAPKRGDELRGDLRHRLGDLRDRSAHQIDELRQRGEELLEKRLEEEERAEAAAKTAKKASGGGATASSKS